MPHPPVALDWACLSNLVDEQAFAARLVLRNVSSRALAPGWAVYFNTARPPLADGVAAGYAIAHVNGDLFCLTAAAAGAWMPGQEHSIDYRARFWAISVTDAPLGFYLVEADGRVSDLGDPRIAPFVLPEQLQRHAGDLLAPADAAWRWRDNARLERLVPACVGRITPQPVSARFLDGSCTLAAHSEIAAPAALAGEAALLRALLDGLLDGPPPGEQAARIVLVTDPAGLDHPEAYRLDIGANSVTVRGASAHGVFNAIQTLAQLLEEDGRLPLGHVADAPRFGYRGMMLDVARHFAVKDTVLRLLDCMARYKLNRLHLHLADDEGWRLHIDALPELTGVGARRGVTGQGAALPPSFGSGADVEASPGTGFYAADDFIAILRYAQARHIEVIPGLNMPGHARAAVVAMRARHDRLLAAGEPEAAAAYLLDEDDDASRYESVQMWHDNVICIALPSVERFVDTVVGHVAALYRQAGVTLHSIHVGGDEVPAGAWRGSPRCRALMAARGWADEGPLHADFVGRCRVILARHGLAFAGWEENALLPSAGGAPAPNPAFAGPGFRVHAWNNAWGSGMEDMAYRLANAGYEVVLANAANLYFDLAYAKDPEEPGYYWAGFVETRDAFAFCPLDMLAGGPDGPRDPMGRPLAAARLAALEPLTAAGRDRIAGLQGQLWGENACSRARIEYLAMPRMIALAERAWAPDPGWSAIADRAARAAAIQADWNEFANRLGQRELARLDRAPLAWRYRLPPPGAVQDGAVVRANVALPGLALHYTLDGSEPTAASARLDAAGAVQPGPRDRSFKVAAFDTRGRKSRTVTLALSALNALESHGQGTR